MNYQVIITNPLLCTSASVVVPTHAIAIGIVSSNMLTGMECSVKMAPETKVSHRNSAYAQAYIDVSMMQLDSQNSGLHSVA
ncbi:hypothetical protein [Xanthomonas phage DES1]|nr:hypothetical protein [Xanthomonas phage DES1]